MEISEKNKSLRGNASQFFVAGELCRRGVVAVVTLGNTPNTDILCSNPQGTRFAHIQVKTFVPGNRTVSVGKKSENNYGDRFFWVLAGIPQPDSVKEFEYYIIPSHVISGQVSKLHREWLAGTKKNGDVRNDSNVRIITLPPRTANDGWSIEPYRNRWDYITTALAM